MSDEDRIVEQALDLIDNMSKGQIIRVLQHIPGMQSRTFKTQIRFTYKAPVKRFEGKLRRRRVRRALVGVKDIMGP